DCASILVNGWQPDSRLRSTAIALSTTTRAASTSSRRSLSPWMVSRTTRLLDSLHTTTAVASYSPATEILCGRAEPEFRCRRGPACALWIGPLRAGQTALFHHASRRRGGVAARGARAAGGQGLASRHSRRQPQRAQPGRLLPNVLGRIEGAGFR